jgi:hypothetical protein
MNTESSKPFSLRIFMPEGQVDGLKIIEKSNWSGRGVVFPRALLPEGKRREEFNRTGVYVLIGPSESGDLPTVYIGQGDPVRPRLESHYARKDFWTQAVFFVSKDENLNKAHIGYLEAKLIRLAKEAKRAKLDNLNEPVLPSMSEMDIADAEGFLDEVLLCLPVLGVTVFAKPKPMARRAAFFLKGRDCEAQGYPSTEGFVVLAGSKARAEEVASIHGFTSELRADLQEMGLLVPEGPHLRLTQDYTFTSPSSAAAVFMARTANGRIEWSDAAGNTLKTLQERESGEEEL